MLCQDKIPLIAYFITKSDAVTFKINLCYYMQTKSFKLSPSGTIVLSVEPLLSSEIIFAEI